jgi:hypothetical protein
LQKDNSSASLSRRPMSKQARWSAIDQARPNRAYLWRAGGGEHNRRQRGRAYGRRILTSD